MHSKTSAPRARKLDISPEEMIQTPVCKNPEEVISKEAFLKGFELCVRQFKGLNQTYFSGIIKRAQADIGIITIEEYCDLVKLLKDEDFLDMANQVFNKAISFSRTAEESLGDINPDTLKNNLILHVYKKVVKDNTGEILLEERGVSGLLLTFEDITIFSKHNRYFIKYIQTGEIKEFSDILIKPEIREIGLIGVNIKGKGWILLNEKGEQVTPEGEFYLKISLERIKKLGLIGVEQDRDSWKFLDKTGKQVSPEGVYYEEFNLTHLEGMILISAKVKGKGWVLLDELLRQISKENTFYKGLIFTEVGLIKAEIDGEGDVLLDKNGQQISPQGEFYENLHIHHGKDIKLMIAKVKGKGWILLDEKGGQISKDGKYYGQINLYNLERYGLIEVEETSGGKILFDINWKQISPHEDRIYDGFDLWRFDEFGLIVGEIRLVTRDIRFHGGILFDKTGKRISPEGEYFDFFNTDNLKEFGLIVGVSEKSWVLFHRCGKRISPELENLDNFDLSNLGETGLIKARIRGKGTILFDKDGKLITPEGKVYSGINFSDFKETGLIYLSGPLNSSGEDILIDKTGKIHYTCKGGELFFDEKINKFYIKGSFGRKKYIEVNLDSKN